MSITLRRSCAACAKAKLGCDLRTPKCTRCCKRNFSCMYANEPLNSRVALPESGSPTDDASQMVAIRLPLLNRNRGNDSSRVKELLTSVGAGTFDPFDSYPQTTLPRMQVQSLIYHFLSKIAFQYYPLEQDPTSNPFVIFWWPLALSDPALFHVTLQTASLDHELLAKRGFPCSEALMADSVSLIRQKIENPSLAFEDATMNAVVTLAAIEHGKGSLQVSRIHVDGVKRMVNVRGGILEVKKTSPLTARMVPWVSMLVIGSPQFQTQDDFGNGGGISTPVHWKEEIPALKPPDPNLLDIDDLGVEPELRDVLTRLRNIFNRHSSSDPQNMTSSLSTTELHDLTCFVLHRLLRLTPSVDVGSKRALLSECLRWSTSLYMFIIHGPTYYSHAAILNSLVLQLQGHLKPLIASVRVYGPVLMWIISTGIVSSMGTSECQWFRDQGASIAAALNMRCWDDVLASLKCVLWLDSSRGEIFRQTWREILPLNTKESANELRDA